MPMWSTPVTGGMSARGRYGGCDRSTRGAVTASPERATFRQSAATDALDRQSSPGREEESAMSRASLGIGAIAFALASIGQGAFAQHQLARFNGTVAKEQLGDLVV